MGANLVAVTLQRYEQFDTQVANETIGPKYPGVITDVSVEGMGEGVGLMSSIARAHLTFSSGATQSVVVKCTARSENSALSKGLNFYKNEVNFYQHLAEQCPLKIPQALYAAVDPITQDFLLVLEDLGAERAGDQIQGCSEQELHVAFERAAQLHARFWGKTEAFDWLHYQLDMRTILFRRNSIFKPGLVPAREKFPGHFTGNEFDLVGRIIERYSDLFLRAMGGEQTIVHGDYRIDNMFITGMPDAPDIIAFDWQNTMGGNGTHDLSYFSLGCCGPELRGDPELRALRHYHDVLTDEGVKGYSFDDCLETYRYNMLINMITPIAISGTLDQGNERGARLGDVMLARAFSAIESLECESLLAGAGAAR